MEKNSRNKRNRNKKRNEELIKTEETVPQESPNQKDSDKEKLLDENSDKFILKKYMDTDMDILNKEELKKIKPFIEEIRNLIKMFKTENFDSLVKYAENQVRIFLS